jgi:hypothetical protein
MSENKRFSFLFDDDNTTPSNKAAETIQDADSNTNTYNGNKWSLLSDSISEQEQPASVKNEPARNLGELIFKPGEAKYRSEQVNVIKVNGIIESHGESKLEYHVRKYIENGQYKVKVSLTDSIMTINPAYLQDSLNLVEKVDLIKSNVILVLDNKTGKITAIDNLPEIKAEWLVMKNRIESNTAYVKDPQTKQNIAEYLVNTEKQFTQESMLHDFKIRPFFDLFFDSYLVTENFSFAPYTKLYYSQLFDQLPVDFDVTQKVVTESREGINILKEATVNKHSPHIKDFERLYDERFKPRIGYKFSDYNFSHTTQASYNYADNLLEEATMKIIEEVQHNVDLFVDYKLRRIK